jgi:hypothetical protein
MTRSTLAALLLLTSLGAASAQRPSAEAPRRWPLRNAPPLVGRWDLTVQSGAQTYPSWLEVQRSGTKTLVGYFVHRGGSVRPISQVQFADGRFQCSFPVQWESGPNDLKLEGRLGDDRLMGTLTDDNGKPFSFTGVRAPDLHRSAEPRWGKPIELFNGKDLAGWKPGNPSRPNGWVVENGVLINAKPGNNLITDRTFNDFRLQAEFRYPKGSNSGIYLRGRYEVQVEDDYGMAPESHFIGGIYGFLTPRVNAAKPAGEWQTFDITLVGRRVTIVHNGETILDRQEIPGITGGALDSREGDPGPIYLQGDHGQIEIRKLSIRPAL